MEIAKVSIPSHSILYKSQYDYADSYTGFFVDKDDKIDLLFINKVFLNSAPKWGDVLLNLRNKIVPLFGLKGAKKPKNKKDLLNNFSGAVGESIGFWKVFAKNESEVILGENDKHLDFKVSLLVDDQNESKNKKLTITTIVNFNHWSGNFYFFLVKPFHQLIVRMMLKKAIRNIEKESIKIKSKITI
ncbi:DUF2867 domain-containing protein [Aquimarina sp. AU119]|uniref:DUF2867 domain-containing protein n=1 Tax=Aquimarina sp. AU119 TaxID=2108528 RepID=UPI000D692CAD|nr:DUF2867 domain-containing protein [Aquimarina sp. AU119]